MIRTDVMILAGSLPSSIAITFDVLATANRLRVSAGRVPAFEVQVTGSGAAGARAMAGSLYRPAGSSGLGQPELVIMPGLGLTSEDEAKTRLAKPDARRAQQALIAAVEAGTEIATSCSGVFLLAQAGLLAGRRATTSWWMAPLFRRLYPDIDLDIDALVIRDGPITTAGAAMAQMDLMLAVVARHASANLADRCAQYLLLDARRSQTRYMALGFLAASDAQLAKAEAWARARLDTDFSVGEMASACGLTPRTFARRVERTCGLSPVRFLQRLRIEVAQELLETTQLPFDEIARRVGYAEPSTLRRIIRRDTGQGPSQLRIGHVTARAS